MSCIIKARRKGTSTVYAYRSESYWIPNVGSRSKRTLLGKIDPETGEIIPTRKRGTKSKKQEKPEQGISNDVEQTLQETKAALIRETERCQELESTVQELKERIRTLESKISSIYNCFTTSASVVQRQMDKCISVIRDF